MSTQITEPTPAQQAPLINIGRIPPAAIIGAIVGGILILGVLFFLLGRATSPDAQALPPEPVPAATALEAEPIVLEEEEVIVPIPDATAPEPEPIPDEPTTEPTPEPTLDPAPTTDPIPQPGTSGESTSVALSGGITPVGPPGWAPQVNQTQTQALFTTSGASIFVGLYTGNPGTTASEFLAFYEQDSIGKDFPDLQTLPPEPLSLQHPSIVSAALMGYRGTLVTQQGSVMLSGFVYAFVRADGTGVIVDGYTSGPDIVDPLLLTVNSILDSM